MRAETTGWCVVRGGPAGLMTAFVPQQEFLEPLRGRAVRCPTCRLLRRADGRDALVEDVRVVGVRPERVRTAVVALLDTSGDGR